jgi:hypothetical protein
VATSSAQNKKEQYISVSNAVLANMRRSSKVSEALSHPNCSNNATEHNRYTKHIIETSINGNKRNVLCVNNGVPVYLLPRSHTIHIYTSAALRPVLTNAAALL